MKSNTDNLLSIQPVIVGRGMSGQAIAKSLALISLEVGEIKLLPFVFAQRGENLSCYVNPKVKNILFIANPSGLHAATLLSGIQSGYSSIVCDKPICVTKPELDDLKNITMPINILHGYRAMWGPRTMCQMIQSGEFGKIFAMECRYWQSSCAQQAVGESLQKRTWKDDVALNGPHDVFIDLGTHVIDMFLYLMNSEPEHIHAWLGYANSNNKHRDTHVHLDMQFSNSCHAIASISKTFHGATNDFSIAAIGTKGSASWSFLKPDEISIGYGSKISILRRSREQQNSQIFMAPFHGLGWLSGYLEIILQSLKYCSGLKADAVPTLAQACKVMECVFAADFTKFCIKSDD